MHRLSQGENAESRKKSKGPAGLVFLVSCLFPHKIDDRRIIQIKVNSYLPPGIAIFLVSNHKICTNSGTRHGTDYFPVRQMAEKVAG